MVAQSHAQSTSHTSIRNMWWTNSVVRRSISYIEKDLAVVIRTAPFLRKTAPSANIVLFHRSEIKTGRLVGSGGFSNVYEVTGFALDPLVSSRCSHAQQKARLQFVSKCTLETRPRYALKQLRDDLIQKSAKDFHCAASDLAIEAAYMSRLSHPNIQACVALPVDGLRAFEDGRHDSFFILSELLDGTLDEKIEQWQENDVSISEKCDYAGQLASALAYLHELRIIFRDLKPQNVGFNTHGQIRLFDFGLCRELPAAGDVNTDVFEMSGVGTRRYMAPEIVLTHAYNCKADVYSLGILFWEMLSCSRPFSKYSLSEHKHRVCKDGERPHLGFHWPSCIQRMLEDSWAEDVTYRLSMAQVSARLESLSLNLALQKSMDTFMMSRELSASTFALSFSSSESEVLVDTTEISRASSLSLSYASPDACSPVTCRAWQVTDPPVYRLQTT